MATKKSEHLIVIEDEQDSIPLSSDPTGSSPTISSANNGVLIIGTNTNFLSDFRRGDFVYIKGQNAFRMVKEIESDTVMYIDKPFQVALSNSTFHITPRANYQLVSLSLSTGDSSIDGVELPEGTVLTRSKDKDGASAAGRKVDPIDVDASTGKKVIVELQF